VEIDHVTVAIRDYVAAKRFYELALAPLGFVVLLDWPDRRRAYFGVEGRPSSIWVVEADSPGGLELSIAASSKSGVHAFHAAALAAGGRSQWEPAAPPVYGRGSYAARVLDPDGNSLEAVFDDPTAARRLAA
jgi:catechol 2,3-dioxygenase-like lactoylglutathione lyase family enzyme